MSSQIQIPPSDIQVIWGCERVARSNEIAIQTREVRGILISLTRVVLMLTRNSIVFPELQRLIGMSSGAGKNLNSFGT